MSVQNGAGSAVGVPKAHWFIARTVRHNTEKAASEQLTKLGYTNYVAIQQEIRVWKNGRRTKVDRVIIPSVIFIKCTEQERRKIVCFPFISRFMTNRAATAPEGLHKPLATVTDSELERLKFMLGASDARVTFVDRFIKGQSVKVVRGALKGLTGQILKDTDGKTSRLYVKIEFLGSASIAINPIDVEVIK